MPKTKEEEFLKACEAKASASSDDQPLKQHLNNYRQAFQEVSTRLQNLPNAKKKAHLIKWKALENLDRYLVDFEAGFTRAGGRVIWANNAGEALEELDKLLSAYAPDAVIANHAMIHEEIGLPEYLSGSRYREEQSDLGRYLVQLTKEKPTHVIHPAIAMDEEDIKKIWEAKHPKETEKPDPTSGKELREEEEIVPGEPFDLLGEFRDFQRQRIKPNAVTISGADYLIADTGSVVVSENEGNDRLFTAFANHHIIFSGIDKILPSLLDLDLFLPLGAIHDQAQHLQAHHTLFTGTRGPRETDGPQETVLILVDNGRSDLLSLTEQRQALYWMECGASTNACGLYEAIGGAAYQTTYPGPMGAVFTPHLQTDESYQYLDYAASFPNASRPNPLDIDIDRLLLKNRHDRVAEAEKPAPESRMWRWHARLAKNRKYADWMTKGIKNLFIKLVFKNAWGEQRALPRVSDKSFSVQWRTKAKDSE